MISAVVVSLFFFVVSIPIKVPSLQIEMVGTKLAEKSKSPGGTLALKRLCVEGRFSPVFKAVVFIGLRCFRWKTGFLSRFLLGLVGGGGGIGIEQTSVPRVSRSKNIKLHPYKILYMYTKQTGQPVQFISFKTLDRSALILWKLPLYLMGTTSNQCVISAKQRELKANRQIVVCRNDGIMRS